MRLDLAVKTMPFFLLCSLLTKADSLWGPRMAEHSSQGYLLSHSRPAGKRASLSLSHPDYNGFGHMHPFESILVAVDKKQ